MTNVDNQDAPANDRQPGAEKSGWRLSIDRNACVSSVTCVGISPDHFESVNGTTRLRATHVDPDEDTREELIDAAESCPMSAIRIVDAATGELIAPQ